MDTITVKFCKLQVATIRKVQIAKIARKWCKLDHPHNHTWMFTFCLFLSIIIDCVVTSRDIQTIQDCLCIVFVDREVRLPVFFCRWLVTSWRRNGSHLRLRYFQRLSATSGGHMSWPTTVTAGALSSFQSNGVGRDFFFLSQKRFYYCHTLCKSFLNLVLWVVCQERGKLGTGFWRHTNFSWQGKPIWSQVSWNRVVHWVAWGTGTPKDRDEEIYLLLGECVI